MRAEGQAHIDRIGKALALVRKFLDWDRAVRRLDTTNTSVWCRDVSAVARGVESGQIAPFDVVTARGFGPPETTLTLATRLLGVSRAGRIVISEPPAGDRWDPALLSRLGLVGERVGPVRCFVRLANPGIQRPSGR